MKATRVAILMTCHNRLDTTRRCLVSIERQSIAEGRSVTIFLNDDGSSDGTREMVEGFQYVKVVDGTGNDYWAGGMRRAWSAAQSTDPDVFILLNDDVCLDEGALNSLVDVVEESGEMILGAAVRDPISGLPSYGGYRVGGRLRPMQIQRVQPSATVVSCDLLNGNIMIMGRTVAQRTGGLDPAFTHGMADFDITWRARKLGIDVFLAPGTWGTCAFNSVAGSWGDRTLPRLDRLARLRRPTGLPAREWLTYCWRHGGSAFPLEFISPYLRLLVGR